MWAKLQVPRLENDGEIPQGEGLGRPSWTHPVQQSSRTVKGNGKLSRTGRVLYRWHQPAAKEVDDRNVLIAHGRTVDTIVSTAR